MVENWRCIKYFIKSGIQDVDIHIYNILGFIILNENLFCSTFFFVSKVKDFFHDLWTTSNLSYSHSMTMLKVYLLIHESLSNINKSNKMLTFTESKFILIFSLSKNEAVSRAGYVIKSFKKAIAFLGG